MNEQTRGFLVDYVHIKKMVDKAKVIIPPNSLGIDCRIVYASKKNHSGRSTNCQTVLIMCASIFSSLCISKSYPLFF